MKKPLKVLSATALTAALASSALVPTVSYAAEENKEYALEYVYLEKESKYYQATYKNFNSAVIAGEKVNTAAVQFNGDIYSVKDFNSASIEVLSDKKPITMENVLKQLDKKSYFIPMNLDVNGTFEYDNGWVYKDEQPEDRLNETFFYNVA